MISATKKNNSNEKVVPGVEVRMFRESFITELNPLNENERILTNMVCLEGQRTHVAVLWDSGGKVAEMDRGQITKGIIGHKRSLDFILMTMESHWQALRLGVTRGNLIKHNSFLFRTQYIFK